MLQYGTCEGSYGVLHTEGCVKNYFPFLGGNHPAERDGDFESAEAKFDKLLSGIDRPPAVCRRLLRSCLLRADRKNAWFAWDAGAIAAGRPRTSHESFCS
jgi:hypothetical protein